MRSMVCESGEFAVSISKVQSVNRLCWALCWRKMMLISRFLVITVPSSTVHAVRSLDSLSPSFIDLLPDSRSIIFSKGREEQD
jgi:hypothetical protein